MKKAQKFLQQSYQQVPADHDDGNQLFFPIQFRDNTKSWEFIRFMNSWGKEQVLDIHDLATQLSSSILNQLIKNRGFMILYTHFNENLAKSIPRNVYNNLRALKKMVDDKDILMGTTSRILKYWEISNYVAFEVRDLQDKVIIKINENMRCPVGIKPIKSFHLSGLTFYIKAPKPHNIIFKNKLCKTVLNPPDETGEKSISIPWEKLEYPKVKIV